MELSIFKNNSNKNLNLDMLYHPLETRILDYLHNFLFLITSFLTVFTLYVVYTKSPQTLGLYKYVLLNSTSWIYIGEVVLFLWRPINVFPYFVFYSSGLFKYLPTDSFIFFIYLLLSALLGMENSFGIAYIFRISQVFYTNWFNGMINNKRNLILLFIGLFIFEEFFLIGKTHACSFNRGGIEPRQRNFRKFY